MTPNPKSVQIPYFLPCKLWECLNMNEGWNDFAGFIWAKIFFDTGSPGKTAGDALMRMSQRLVLLVADFVGNTGQKGQSSNHKHFLFHLKL